MKGTRWQRSEVEQSLRCCQNISQITQSGLYSSKGGSKNFSSNTVFAIRNTGPRRSFTRLLRQYGPGVRQHVKRGVMLGRRDRGPAILHLGPLVLQNLRRL